MISESGELFRERKRLTNLYRNFRGIRDEGRRNMEQTKQQGNRLWRIWVDPKNRIISFHEAEGYQLMEFRSRDMFLTCVDEFSGKQYRYQ